MQIILEKFFVALIKDKDKQPKTRSAPFLTLQLQWLLFTTWLSGLDGLSCSQQHSSQSISSSFLTTLDSSILSSVSSAWSFQLPAGGLPMEMIAQMLESRIPELFTFLCSHCALCSASFSPLLMSSFWESEVYLGAMNSGPPKERRRRIDPIVNSVERVQNNNQINQLKKKEAHHRQMQQPIEDTY